MHLPCPNFDILDQHNLIQQNKNAPKIGAFFIGFSIAICGTFVSVDNGDVKLYTNFMEKILKGYSVIVDDNGIVKDIVADGTDNIVVSGLCDIHTHGAMGFDISCCSQDALDTISKYYLDNGITAFSPTFVATPLDVLDKQLTTLYSLKQNYAVMLPAHLEGPFISKAQKGAQPECNIIDTFTNDHKWFFEKHRNHIGIVTICPSVGNATALVEFLVSLGIKVQAGHDNSNYTDIVKAVESGLDGVTHLGCASSVMKRDESLEKHLGLTETALYLDNLSVELIVDDKHLSKDVVQMVHKIKSQDKIIYVSDSLSTAGMPKGEYMLGDMPVVSDGKVSYLKNMTTLAGSVTNLLKSLHLSLEYGNSIDTALSCVSTNPRKYVGLPTQIKVGDKGDFVVFDHDGNLRQITLGTTTILK